MFKPKCSLMPPALPERIFKKSLICLLTIVPLLACGELLARYIGAPQPYGALFVYDKNLGYRSPTNKQISFAIGRHTYSISFDEFGIADSAGYHNKEIIILGDGVIAGLELRPQQRLAHQLSALLRGKGIVNLSVTGYGTIQQALLLEDWLARHPIPPKDVILVFNLSNDVLDNVREWDTNRVPAVSLDKRDGVILSPELPSTFHRMLATIYHESRLAGFLNNLRYYKADEKLITPTRNLFDTQTSPEMNAALLGTSAGFAKLEHLSQKYRFRLYGVFWVDTRFFNIYSNDHIMAAIHKIEKLTYNVHWLQSIVPLELDSTWQERNRVFLVDGTAHANLSGTNKLLNLLVHKFHTH